MSPLGYRDDFGHLKRCNHVESTAWAAIRSVVLAHFLASMVEDRAIPLCRRNVPARLKRAPSSARKSSLLRAKNLAVNSAYMTRKSGVCAGQGRFQRWLSTFCSLPEAAEGGSQSSYFSYACLAATKDSPVFSFPEERLVLKCFLGEFRTCALTTATRNLGFSGFQIFSPGFAY